MTASTPKIPDSENPRVLPPKFPFRHRTPVQMRFTDIDMLGHVNNNAYLSYMDLAKVDYFAAVLPKGVEWREIGCVVVHISSDFFAPAYFTEHLEVLTMIESVSKRSFTMEQRVISVETGLTKCMSRTVMAGFDPDLAIGIPLKEKWVEYMEKFEARPLRAH